MDGCLSCVILGKNSEKSSQMTETKMAEFRVRQKCPVPDRVLLKASSQSRTKLSQSVKLIFCGYSRSGLVNTLDHVRFVLIAAHQPAISSVCSNFRSGASSPCLPRYPGPEPQQTCKSSTCFSEARLASLAQKFAAFPA